MVDIFTEKNVFQNEPLRRIVFLYNFTDNFYDKLGSKYNV